MSYYNTEYFIAEDEQMLSYSSISSSIFFNPSMDK